MQLLYTTAKKKADELSRRTDRLRGRAERLTREQIETITAFLRIIQHRTPISGWGRECITRALELVWER
jgi:hypothetical protein